MDNIWHVLKAFGYDFNPNDGTLLVSGSPTKLDVPEKLGELTIHNLGDYTFYNKGLHEVSMTDSVKRIGIETFASNRISMLTLSQQLEFIGERAFYLNNLTYLRIPDSVTAIGNQAFANNKLSIVHIPDSVKVFGTLIFNGNSDGLIIVCSKGSAAEQYALENGHMIDHSKKITYATSTSNIFHK